jgi:tripartite-type tricarboxylate transporter receptor subunit TctC
MKKLILSLILSLASAANAQMTVVSPFTAGSIVDITCRKIFDIYDSMNSSSTVFLVMPGADHMIAHRHFITMTEHSVFCAGSGVGGFNQHNNPKISPPVDTLKPIVDVYSLSHFILAPAKSPSLEELMINSKRTGKSILVGAPSSNAALVLTYVLEKNNVKFEIVAYKKPSDAVVSLVDGSLDTYVDGGSIKLLGDIAGIKEIAHVSIGSDKTTTVNLHKKYRDLENIVSKVTLYARSNTSDSEIQLLNTRLNTVMNSDQFQIFRKERLSMVQMTNGTVKQANQTITNIGVYLKNVHN